MICVTAGLQQHNPLLRCPRGKGGTTSALGAAVALHHPRPRIPTARRTRACAQKEGPYSFVPYLRLATSLPKPPTPMYLLTPGEISISDSKPYGTIPFS